MNAPDSTPSPACRTPLTRPDTGGAELAELKAVLHSGWLTTGPRVAAFEERVARRLGAGVHCAALASCTDALRLALRLVGVKEGDEVIVPTWTFTATAEAVEAVGARPVLVDVEPGTLNLDPAAAAAAITTRTKAILPVHFAGLPVDMDAVLDIARAHDLVVVEDAAHAFGAGWRGRAIGAIEGSVTCFSFHATKNLPCGEGGMLTTSDPDLAARARSLAIHGRKKHVDAERPWLYDVTERGEKCNLSDLHAALGLAQLPRFDAAQARRARLAQRYREGLGGLPLLLPPEAPDHITHGQHLFVIQVLDSAPLNRDALWRALDRSRVETAVHFRPLHQHTYWAARLRPDPASFPVAEQAASRVLSLPFFALLDDEAQDGVICAVRRALCES